MIQDTILKQKSLKVLRINQKFTFKFDHLARKKVKQFKIETDKKNEIVFTKSITEEAFDIKKIKKIL